MKSYYGFMRFKLKKGLEKTIRNSIQKCKNNYYKF